MKISLQWLGDYLDLPTSEEETAEILTNIGLEVEGTSSVERVRGGLKGLVIGEVLECERHPNADKLSLTRVRVSAEGEPLQIVCGAPNVAKGQKVVVATEGTKLYPMEGEPFVIKKGKIRGESSEGMICAEDEIGLGTGHAGIMVLAADAPVGAAFADFVGMQSDTVWDINLTPNRSDAHSHIGVAFDLAAALQIQKDANPKFRRPDVAKFSELLKGKTQNLPIEISVLDANQCARYAGIIISGLRVAPSPDWLQQRLRAIGLSPINNIVDITNFVLHELGQPLHAFDYDKIETQSIRVQTLAEGTAFTTLDGQTRKLSGEDLMICDGKNTPLCIAGVFGGKDSGVTESTTTIFLESAFFNPTQVRRTSLRHQLRTDAAARFEKTVDIQQVVYALQRAALLLCEIAGGSIASELIDRYPQSVERRQVQLDYAQVQKLIGVKIESSEIQRILAALDMQILRETKEGVLLNVPTNKTDVTRPADVIEEILRIYGYNRVPTPDTLSSVLAFAPRPNPVSVQNGISDMLSARGFMEMMATSMTRSQYFVSEAGGKCGIKPQQLVYVNNTSNQQLDIMRPSMLYSGLEAIAHNQNRQNPNLRLYEFGKTYLQTTETDKPSKYSEEKHLSIFLTGEYAAAHWLQNPAPATNFFHLKNSVETVFARLGIDSSQLQQQVVSTSDEDPIFAYALRLTRGKQIIAQLGRVHPTHTQALDIRQAVFFADLHWEALLQMLQKQKIQYQPLPKYPSVRRDLALVLDQKVAFSQVQTIATQKAKKLLRSLSLFDVFADEQKIGVGKKSYAISLVFQDTEKTLRDEDTEKLMQQITQALEQQLSATIRR